MDPMGIISSKVTGPIYTFFLSSIQTKLPQQVARITWKMSRVYRVYPWRKGAKLSPTKGSQKLSSVTIFQGQNSIKIQNSRHLCILWLTSQYVSCWVEKSTCNAISTGQFLTWPFCDGENVTLSKGRCWPPTDCLSSLVTNWIIC